MRVESESCVGHETVEIETLFPSRSYTVHFCVLAEEVFGLRYERTLLVGRMSVSLTISVFYAYHRKAEPEQCHLNDFIIDKQLSKNVSYKNIRN